MDRMVRGIRTEGVEEGEGIKVSKIIESIA